MTEAKRRSTEARVVGRVVEVAVEKAASLQSSLPQKQVEASFKVSSPMSKETPDSRCLYISSQVIEEKNLGQHPRHIQMFGS